MSLLSISKDDESWELEIPGAPDDCSYIPGQTTHIVYRLAATLSETRYEQLLNRGWRRFGRTLFRPACQACRGLPKPPRLRARISTLPQPASCAQPCRKIAGHQTASPQTSCHSRTYSTLQSLPC
ncbi:MAG UNVERIFIED_CONTAM: hypothetical protein LVR18_18325 [Planctomycetaceae bacterium]